MADFPLTESQRRAIEADGKNILVSASAGSGKTFVMIERIINLIIEKGVDIENILAVTYTNLAASEMKQKLVRAVIKRISEGKDVARMKHTLTEIPTADVCTFHSFCLNLLRTYFYVAGVDPDFSILDESKAKELSQSAIDKVFNDLYQEKDEDFLKTVRLFRAKRGDSDLKAMVLRLYEFSRSEGDPEGFVKRCAEGVTEQNYFRYKSELLALYRKKLSEKLTKARGYKEEFAFFAASPNGKKVYAVYEELLKKYEECISCADDLFKNAILSELSRTPSFRNDDTLTDLLDTFKALKEEATSLFTAIKRGLDEDGEEGLDAFLSTGQSVKTLCNLTTLFSQKYDSVKRSEGVVDFSDLEHKTLALLTNNPDILELIREKYKYVFADEYQDVNGVQESILNLISHDNLFMVGDVKQSIYAFRGCNPDIFSTKFDLYEQTGQGEAIYLDKNFRSSDGVLSAVNGVFNKVITKSHGGVDYAKSPMQRGGLFPDGYGAATLHVLNLKKPEKQSIEALYDLVGDALCQEDEEDFYEGALVARIIEKEKNGVIFDAKLNKERPVELSDITVLTRNSSGYTEEIVKRLVRGGIPVSAESKTSILEYPEIKLLVDLLRLISYFADDPPLCAVLKSAVGKLSDSDLAEIRNHSLGLKENGSSLTFKSCVERYLNGGRNAEIKAKISAFWEYFDGIRTLAEFSGAGEILSKILRDSGLDLEIACRPLGAHRLARINRFIAESTPDGKPLSVGEFLQRIENADKSITLSEISGNNAVRVMSMHSSKGLEFPIVILAGLHRQFNAMDDRQELLISRANGICVYSFDEENKTKRSTVARAYFKELSALSRIDEEARVFYVAMTRAQARLHLVSAREIIENEGKYSHSSVNRFSDFLCLNEMNAIFYEQEDVAYVGDRSYQTVSLDGAKPSLVELIKSNLSFCYPDGISSKLPLKSSVTGVNERHNDIKSGAPTRTPHLESRTDEDKKERGVAYHRFLEVCDFNEKDANNQLIRLLSRGDITKAQADLLDEGLLNKILSHGIFDELKAYKLYKEQPFMTTFTARELYGDDSDSEVLVQGIIDLLAVKDGEVIIVDYKTSAHLGERLKKDYEMQLYLYKRAVEKCLGLTVRGVYILSLITGELIGL